jgi:UDP-N-acetyl-D-glucosamine dehydrogenase
MRVAIIGQGYVGLMGTLGCLRAGYEVIGIEKNQKLIENLNRGISHIEGISNEAITSGIKSGTFIVTDRYSQIEDADVVIIAVPTPLNSEREPDLSMLESAVDSIAPYLKENSLVINESTSYIGTLRNVVAN